MSEAGAGADRRAALLRALAGRAGAVDLGDVGFPGGAGLVGGEAGWVLLGPGSPPGLGPALAWARRHRVAALHVVVEDAGAAGVLARRAPLFAVAPRVWSIAGRELVPAVPAPPPPPPAGPAAPALRALFAAVGLEVVEGVGVVGGERRGLEVARIVDGPDGPVLEVGVGRFDQELEAMTHAHLDREARLRRVVAVVDGHHRPGAPPHPLNQLVPERWLRVALVAEPGRVGAVALRPVPSAVPRRTLHEAGVATAVGVDREGRPLVVACGAGTDLDLAAAAADDRAWHAPGARLVLAVPAAGVLPVTAALAAALADPAEVVPVDGVVAAPPPDGPGPARSPGRRGGPR